VRDQRCIEVLGDPWSMLGLRDVILGSWRRRGQCGREGANNLLAQVPAYRELSSSLALDSD
jgi:hypothetical protein